MKTIELKVKGLCCTDCAAKIEKLLRNTMGVMDLKILMAAEKAVITYNESRIAPDDLIKKIESLGYKTHVSKIEITEKPEKKRDLANILRLTFITIISIVALGEILLGYLGILKMGIQFIPLLLILSAIFLGGYPIFKKAFLGLINRQINVDLVMSLGIIGAALIGEFIASMLVAFFMNLAHYLEDFTVTRSRKAIKELLKLAPACARVKLDDKEMEVNISEIKHGDIVVVRPGEKIAVDGIVKSGQSSVNQASITGESIPVEKIPGDEVFAGTLNESGYLEIDTRKVGEETTLGKIIKLVEEAEANKAPIQRFADRFATYFLPSALTFAFLTYLISGKAIYAIAVLVAACPCAVGLATPLSVIASVGSGAKRGLLIKGGLYLEALAKVDCVVMDKTGTVTFGKPQVTDVISLNNFPLREILTLAASVERYSEHSLASAILEEAKTGGIEIAEPEGFEYLIGKGISGNVRGKVITLGNQRLLEEKGITISQYARMKAQELEEEGNTALFLSVDSEASGIIAVSDVIRGEVPRAIEELKKLGIARLILLTGDNERVASAISRRIGVTEYRANLLPQEKLEIVKSLQNEGCRVCMIGDGVNDALALTQADVGIAMGVAGTDVAIEAAHVALMRDDWTQVPHAIKVGRRTYRIIRQGIALSIIWDIITMGLASVGILTPILAAAFEELPTLAVAANASRLLVNSRKVV
ncbi:MAG: cation-translocating P-type ATPase [Nitrospirota bacterium]